jgi:hypothetical protein
MIKKEMIEVSFDINTLEMSGYLIVDKVYGFAHFRNNK